MERDIGVDTVQLLEQVKQVMVVQGEVEVQEGRLVSVCEMGQLLQDRLSHDSREFMVISNWLEVMQDRWDILIEILEAQKQRISSLGIEFKSVAKSELDKQGRQKKERDISPDDVVSSKKRKVTGTRRISFESSYARISGWAEHILSRLEDGVAGLELVDQQFLHEETEAEVKGQQEQVEELVSLGEQLIKDIESEDNFPPDYLENVSGKIAGSRTQLNNIKIALNHLKENINYQVEKKLFYELLSELSRILESYQTFLDQITFDQVSDLTHLDSCLVECQSKLQVLRNTDIKLEEVRKISGQLALHSGASLEPSNSIKADCYNICDKFESLEAKFGAFIKRLQDKAEKFKAEATAVSDPKEVNETCDIKHPSDESTYSVIRNKSEDGGDPTHESHLVSDSDTDIVSEISNSDEKGHTVKGPCDDAVDHDATDEDIDPVDDSDDSLTKSVTLTDPGTGTLTDTGTGTVYHSSATTSGDCSSGKVISTVPTNSVSSLTIPVLHREKSEVFITLQTVENDTDSSMSSRDPSKLELDLLQCRNLLSSTVFLEDSHHMEDIWAQIEEHIHLFDEAFVPAYLTEDEAGVLVEQIMEVKTDLRSREEELKLLSNTLNQWREELQGLSMWMKEVAVFLHAEDAAFGDLETLEAQLKESNALQEDILTLQPNVENINDTGQSLLGRCDQEGQFKKELGDQLDNVNTDWDVTVNTANKQNNKLRKAFNKSSEVVELVREINQFLDQLEGELAGSGEAPVTAAPELSQRTYKLLQLRDKTDVKSEALQRLSTIEVEGGAGEMEAQIMAVQDRWSEVTGPVHTTYSRMKEATTDYGEFKTLVAQEGDWLDRLEKKLRRSSKCAADAEEISEELDDIENCLNNHPDDRVDRLRQLAEGLGEKEILISPVQTEANKLSRRWEELERQARLRIKSLEECIMEAQEWECKILCVQDWLQEKDMLLTSHLEHELTVDDLPDDTQRMLREFEDKENLLAEMEGQVDAYRDAGKEEAATRLEDQLTLIHTKFQELSGKFEMFQRPADYDGRLGRISRQLQDVQSNMYLTELVSHEPEAIQGQLHHTRCFYNALAEIKPEVEATIKMGRKLVETGSVPEPSTTSSNIDDLKELFNVLGAQVTEARGNLERALGLADTLMCLLGEVVGWLEDTEELLEKDRDHNTVREKVVQMKDMKRKVREILAVKVEFVSLCGDPSLLVGLREVLAGLEAKWSGVKVMLEGVLEVEEGQSDLRDLSLDSEDGERLMSPAGNSFGEEGQQLQEFRTAFQEVSSWLDQAERKLERERRESEDRQLGEQMVQLRPKVENLGAMAVRIVERFNSQKMDVEPEMETLGQRWETVVGKMDGSNDFSLVEVEKISTTTSQMVIPAPAGELEEIMTLPEEPTQAPTPLKRSLPLDLGSPKRSMMTGQDDQPSTDSSQDTVTISSSSMATVSKIPRPVSNTTPKSRSPIKEVKTPPPTLPKPRWYVESLQTSCITSPPSSPPVKQVVVTSSTLPSPRSLVSPPSTLIHPHVTTEPSPTRSPELTVLPGSPMQESPSTALDSVDLQNERDNAIIDRLLRGTSADIEDVKARSKVSQSTSARHNMGHSRDIKQFMETAVTIKGKLDLARQRLEQLTGEMDLELRGDLVEMETQQLEAEVATTISRGETLVLMIHRQDTKQAEELQKNVGQVREAWQAVRKVAERKKSEAKGAGRDQEKFTRCKDSLLAWLDELQTKIGQAKGDKKELSILARKMEEKKSELTAVNKLGTKLTAANAFKGQEANLTSINHKWGQAWQECSPVARRESSKSASPREGLVDRTVPAELTNKVARVREAVNAVQKQLTLSVLTGSKFDKLEMQGETLDRVKSALETLKPKVKKTEKDLELVSGSLSMEYFEKLTSLGEKCRGEWTKVNQGYQEKRRVWEEARQEWEKFTVMVRDAKVWLGDKEKLVLTWKQDNKQLPLASVLNRIEREVLDWQKVLADITLLGKRIGTECESSQSRGVFDTCEELERRWRVIVTEVTSRKNSEEVDRDGGNMNLIVNWTEQSLALITKQVNVSELSQLREAIRSFESAQVEVVRQRVALDELSLYIGVNSPVFQQTRAKVERINQMLPKRLNYLVEKGEKLSRLVEMVETGSNWVEETKEGRLSITGAQEQLKLRLSVSDKEYEMNQLFNEFLLLEREVTGAGMDVNNQLAKQVRVLKDNWISLLGDVRRVSLNGNVTTTTQLTSPDRRSIKTVSTSPDRSISSYQLTPSTLGSCVVKTSLSNAEVTSPSDSVSSMASLVTLTSPSTSEMVASPTTASASPMSEEVVSVAIPVSARDPETVLASLAVKSGQVISWLGGLVREGERGEVRVENTEAVGRELDRYRALLQQLDGRKIHMEEIVATATDLHTGSEEVVNQINILKAEWKETQQKLLGRKTELTAMLEHSDNLDSKGREVSDWLGKLERQLAGATVGRTRDVLLAQIREVNQVMRELQKYSHHVTLFTQMCHRLVSIYSGDQTDGIQQLAGELSGRYSGLTSSCTARAKSLQAALESLNMFDRELAEFLAWLGEVETSVERLDGDGNPTMARLRDLQGELRDRDRQFCSLASRGKEQIAAAGDSDIVLGSKIGELGRRWSMLQNMIMGIQDKVDREGEHLREKLETIRQWLDKKRVEVDKLEVGDNLGKIKRQKEEHKTFREKIEARRGELDMNLSEGIRQKMEGIGQMEEDWQSLLAVTESWTRELDMAETGVRQIDEALTALDRKVCRVETEQASWSLPPSIDTVEGEREDLEMAITVLHQLEEEVMQTKLVSDSAPAVGQAAHQKLVTIEKRLTDLHEAARFRREQLTVMDVVPDPASQQFLASSVPAGWERCLTQDCVPYFSCHDRETTQWDHPEFVSLMETIVAMNTVKFSAYRLALKLRKIQQKLCLDLLDIASAVVCFDSHGLTSEKHDLTICVPEMVTILTSVYETLYQCEPEDITVNVCVDLALNWILNVFDSQRQGFTRVLSFKLGLVLLCRGPLLEKYSVMFQLAAGGETARLDQRRLGLLLYDLVMVPKYLGEVAQFGGSNIEPSVRSCLSVGVKEPRTSLDCDMFVKWLQDEPQSLVWLPVLHRLASAETATHDVKCRICRVDPIVGFRYHCRKCFNLDICHACFFVGKSYKGHKPEHPMQEYCTSTNKTDNARHILQAVRNSFRTKKYFKKKQAKLGYLPVQSVLEGESFESPALSPNLSFESRDFVASDSVGGSLALSTRQEEDDEHSLIAAYCKLLTGTNNNNLPSTASILLDVDQRLDSLEKEAIEQYLEQLKEENIRLEAEHKELLAGQNRNSVSVEEKTLRQQRARLEARMAIVEDHNRQLEAQLERLRQLVHSGTEVVGVEGVGLHAKYVVAAEMHNQEIKAEPGLDRPLPPGKERRQPPTGLAVPKRENLGSERSSGSFRDSGTSGEGDQRNSATSGSLNLSQHNTETQDD